MANPSTDLRTALVLALSLLLFGGMPLRAQGAQGGPIHAVTHVDFMPDHLQAVSALEHYVAEEKHDGHVLRVELLQQISAGNHFTLVETFPSMAAYNAHSESPYTRHFRAAIS